MGVHEGERFMGKGELAVACVHSSYDAEVDLYPEDGGSVSPALALCLGTLPTERAF